MNIFRSLASAIVVVPALFIVSGCETVSDQPKYIDSKGTSTLNTLNQINIQDWNSAAEKLVASLLANGVLEKAPSQPAVMAISRIVNNTQQQTDLDSLTRKIRVALNQSGKVITTTTLGLGGSAEDPLARDARRMEEMMGGKKQVTQLPYYTLSGKLLEDRARLGSTRQVTFTFQLSLTTVKDGLAVWEAEEQITKQASTPAATF